MTPLVAEPFTLTSYCLCSSHPPSTEFSATASTSVLLNPLSNSTILDYKKGLIFIIPQPLPTLVDVGSPLTCGIKNTINKLITNFTFM